MAALSPGHPIPPPPLSRRRYVPWNWHELAPNTFDFSGARNLTQFAKLAQANGLLLLLRAGP